MTAIFPEGMMDEVRAAGWTRFRPVAGQPIAEKDMRKVFRLVDLDKDGSISHMVGRFQALRSIYIYSIPGAEAVFEISWEEIRAV